MPNMNNIKFKELDEINIKYNMLYGVDAITYEAKITDETENTNSIPKIMRLRDTNKKDIQYLVITISDINVDVLSKTTKDTDSVGGFILNSVIPNQYKQLPLYIKANNKSTLDVNTDNNRLILEQSSINKHFLVVYSKDEVEKGTVSYIELDVNIKSEYSLYNILKRYTLYCNTKPNIILENTYKQQLSTITDSSVRNKLLTAISMIQYTNIVLNTSEVYNTALSRIRMDQMLYTKAKLWTIFKIMDDISELQLKSKGAMYKNRLGYILDICSINVLEQISMVLTDYCCEYNTYGKYRSTLINKGDYRTQLQTRESIINPEKLNEAYTHYKSYINMQLQELKKRVVSSLQTLDIVVYKIQQDTRVSIEEHELRQIKSDIDKLNNKGGITVSSSVSQQGVKTHSIGVLGLVEVINNIIKQCDNINTCVHMGDSRISELLYNSAKSGEVLSTLTLLVNTCRELYKYVLNNLEAVDVKAYKSKNGLMAKLENYIDNALDIKQEFQYLHVVELEFLKKYLQPDFELGE